MAVIQAEVKVVVTFEAPDDATPNGIATVVDNALRAQFDPTDTDAQNVVNSISGLDLLYKQGEVTLYTQDGELIGHKGNDYLTLDSAEDVAPEPEKS